MNLVVSMGFHEQVMAGPLFWSSSRGEEAAAPITRVVGKQAPPLGLTTAASTPSRLLLLPLRGGGKGGFRWNGASVAVAAAVRAGSLRRQGLLTGPHRFSSR